MLRNPNPEFQDRMELKVLLYSEKVVFVYQSFRYYNYPGAHKKKTSPALKRRISPNCTVLRGLQPSEAKRGSAERSEAVRCRAKRGFTERSEALPSEARLYRAKRGFTERSEAPPRLRRAKRGRAKVIGREVARDYDKKTQKGSTLENPGEPLFGSILSTRFFFRNPGFFGGFEVTLTLFFFENNIFIE